jgi:2,4-dienoyl-CoA reductase-like NADH-dependent reductase (Old Yellow Enzyme family)/thioredoxin reductase
MSEQLHFPKLFEEGRIGKVTINNRIVMAPLGTPFWGMNGEVTDRLTDHYVARAKGGTGLITVSMAAVDYPPGYGARCSLDQPEDDRKIPLHYTFVEKLHSYGAKVSLQVNHMGRQGYARPGFEFVSASPVHCIPIGKAPYPVPRALKKDEIYQIMDRFAAVTVRAKRAGYDMIEIHGAHGYLVNSFMSPYMNKRKDDFGGSLENRMRFPTELIKRMKEAAGDDYPIGIRIVGDEFIDGGITTEESPIMARMLEEAGAAFIHAASGLYETWHKSNDISRLPEGWKSYIWEAIRKTVTIPIFAAGGSRTPEFCESVVATGKADFIALGRQMFADPEWPNKAKTGRVNEIRKCISCMECLGGLTGRAADTRCAVNVAVGREKDFGEIIPTKVKRKVAVIGAGPGGMEAARIAALRGHEVTLYDSKNEIGGQLLLAATPPGKQKLLWFRDYQATQLRKLDVKVELGVEVTAELVEKSQPDAVIVATGSLPIVPEIPGVNKKKVLTGWEVLEKNMKIENKKVVIAGGGMVGAEVAEFLAEQGNRITIVEMLPRIAAEMEPLNRHGLIEALQNRKVVELTEHDIVEVNDNGLKVLDRNSRQVKLIEGDLIILTMGARPATELIDGLRGKVPQLFIVGDCHQPRTIMAAVYEGAFSAKQIQ